MRPRSHFSAAATSAAHRSRRYCEDEVPGQSLLSRGDERHTPVEKLLPRRVTTICRPDVELHPGRKMPKEPHTANNARAGMLPHAVARTRDKGLATGSPGRGSPSLCHSVLRFELLTRPSTIPGTAPRCCGPDLALQDPIPPGADRWLEFCVRYVELALGRALGFVRLNTVYPNLPRRTWAHTCVETCVTKSPTTL